jgi:hypothetical protein
MLFKKQEVQRVSRASLWVIWSSIVQQSPWAFQTLRPIKF